jgi:hypothetical protein
MWQPFGTNSSTNATWTPAPTQRGTLDVLSSCLLTLVLCTYSCLHLNIPEHGKTHWSQKLKKSTPWVLFGRLLLLVEQAYGNRHSYTYFYLWFPRAKDLCMVAYGELVRSFATNLLRKVREVDTHFLVWPPYSQPLRQFRAG